MQSAKRFLNILCMVVLILGATNFVTACGGGETTAISGDGNGGGSNGGGTQPGGGDDGSGQGALVGNDPRVPNQPLVLPAGQAASVRGVTRDVTTETHGQPVAASNGSADADGAWISYTVTSADGRKRVDFNSFGSNLRAGDNDSRFRADGVALFSGNFDVQEPKCGSFSDNSVLVAARSNEFTTNNTRAVVARVVDSGVTDPDHAGKTLPSFSWGLANNHALVDGNGDTVAIFGNSGEQDQLGVAVDRDNDIGYVVGRVSSGGSTTLVYRCVNKSGLIVGDDGMVKTIQVGSVRLQQVKARPGLAGVRVAFDELVSGRWVAKTAFLLKGSPPVVAAADDSITAGNQTHPRLDVGADGSAVLGFSDDRTGVSLPYGAQIRPNGTVAWLQQLSTTPVESGDRGVEPAVDSAGVTFFLEEPTGPLTSQLASVRRNSDGTNARGRVVHDPNLQRFCFPEAAADATGDGDYLVWRSSEALLFEFFDLAGNGFHGGGPQNPLRFTAVSETREGVMVPRPNGKVFTALIERRDNRNQLTGRVPGRSR